MENSTTLNPNKIKLYKVFKVLNNILKYGFLSILGIFIVFPFIYMIFTSFKGSWEFEKDASLGILRILPEKWTTDNYRSLIFRSLKSSNNFLVYYGNTLIVAFASTAFTLVTSVLAAFAFARCEFKGRDFVFSILLATMMIPGEIMVITNYQTVAIWGWLNSYSALIFVHGVSVFYIFYLKQTFQQIPNELFLAAKVDGYGYFAYLWRVMIPIAMPTIITILILALMGAWNAYVWPQLVASGLYKSIAGNHSMKLVSNGLMDMFTGEFADNKPARIAGSMLVTAPLFVFFLIFRKNIMSGISRSGIKG
jgi:multiple sugar transport system permease protein